jgi:hypothetical protein
MNPINRENIYTNLHFNSKYRSDYYNTSSTNFNYNLPEPVDNIKSIKLSSICIPNTWYLYSHAQGNNRFIVEISGGCYPFSVFEIVIPDGNYTPSELVDYLNNSYFHNSGEHNGLKYVRFSINPYNLKTIIELVDAPPDVEMNLIFVNDKTDSIMYTAGWTFGYRYGKYTNITHYAMSEGLYDGGGDRYIYFSLDDYNKNTHNTNIAMFDESIMSEHNILAKIYLKDGKFAINIDNTPELRDNHVKTRRYFGPVNLKKFRVKILDQYGREIHLNNMDFSFSLEVEQAYRK